MPINLTPVPSLTPATATPPIDLATSIANAAPGPKSITVDGQTTDMHSLPDQIAADRYARSNAAMKRRTLPIRRIQFVRPGASGLQQRGNHNFYSDPNWT